MTTLSFSQDTYPTLKKIDGVDLVLITPFQLKQVNFVFASHQKLMRDNAILKAKVNLLEEANEIQGEEIGTLKSVIALGEEKDEKNDKIIEEQNKQIKLLTKRNRRNIFGGTGLVIIAVVVTAVIIK